LEQALLDKWFGTEMCYNLRPLATGGQGPATEETKQKMSNSHKGKKKSDQTKVAISRSRTGMKFTEEHKQNISRGKTGQSHYSWNKGKSWFYNISTLETKMFFSHPGDGWDKGRGPKCL
jgi:glutamine cyclotransferase